MPAIAAKCGCCCSTLIVRKRSRSPRAIASRSFWSCPSRRSSRSRWTRSMSLSAAREASARRDADGGGALARPEARAEDTHPGDPSVLGGEVDLLLDRERAVGIAAAERIGDVVTIGERASFDRGQLLDLVLLLKPLAQYPLDYLRT